MEEEVQTNVKTTLQSVMDEIHRLVKGTMLHTVVMFDELMTEKRICWDLKEFYRSEQNDTVPTLLRYCLFGVVVLT